MIQTWTSYQTRELLSYSAFAPLLHFVAFTASLASCKTLETGLPGNSYTNLLNINLKGEDSIMARFNCEFEIDWLDKEENIDDLLKEMIVASVETKIVAKIQKEIQDQTQQRITDKIEGMVTNDIEEKIKRFFDKPRNITDKYGEVTRENITVETLLKEKLEEAMTKKILDKEGNRVSYRPEYSLFEFIATKNLDKLVEEKVVLATKDTKKEIGKMVTSALKGQIANNLTDFILKNSSVLGIEKK